MLPGSVGRRLAVPGVKAATAIVQKNLKAKLAVYGTEMGMAAAFFQLFAILPVFQIFLILDF